MIPDARRFAMGEGDGMVDERTRTQGPKYVAGILSRL